MAGGQYAFIFYPCTLYIEKAFGIVVDVHMWCDMGHEFESLID